MKQARALFFVQAGLVVVCASPLVAWAATPTFDEIRAARRTGETTFTDRHGEVVQGRADRHEQGHDDRRDAVGKGGRQRLPRSDTRNR